MTESNSTPGPQPEDSSEPQVPQPPPDQAPAPAPPPPKPARKRRRRWPWVIGVIVLLLILLVCLLPTFLTMGWARVLVLSQVNGRLNGSIEIGDWSLGWFTPVKVNGIVINDASHRQILQLPQFSTDLTLLDVVRGKYKLGQTKIEGLDLLVSREADGSINWQHLARSAESSAPAEKPSTTAKQEESKLPDVSGELVLSNCSLTYEDRTGATPPVQLRNVQAELRIPSINDPITDSFSAQAIVGTNPPGTITASGSVRAVTNNAISQDTPDVDQTLKLSGMELTAVSALLGSAVPVKLAGRTDGQVVIHLAKGADGTVQANVDTQHFAASGGKMGDANLTGDSLSLRLAGATIRLASGAKNALEDAKVDLGQGVTFQAANINIDQGHGSTARSIVKGDTFNFDARGAYSADANGKALNLVVLNAGDTQQLFSIRQGSPVEFSLPAKGNPTARGGIEIAADLKRLAAIVRTSPSQQVQNGTLAASIVFSQDGNGLHVSPQATISNLSLKQNDATYSTSKVTLNSDYLVVSEAGQIQEVRIARNDLDLNDPVIKGQVFPEKKLHVGAMATYHPAGRLLDLKNLTLQTATTDAIALIASGKIIDVGGQQKFDTGFGIDLNYEASQLLKLIVPLLSPDMQAKLKDAQAIGKYQKRIDVRGAYPSGQPFNIALKQFVALTEIQLDSFKGAGLEAENIHVPITVADDYVRIIYGDKPTGPNIPPPITLNGGKLNIGGSQIDLHGATPTLSILDNLLVMDNVALNPIFASWSLGEANPFFVEPKDATGFLSLRVIQCHDLPLDSSLTTANATAGATLDLSVRQLQVSNDSLEKLASVARFDVASIRGDLQSGRITLDHGILDQDLTITLLQGQRPLRVYGKMRLADKQLMPLTLNLPWKLFGLKGVPKQAAGFLPDGIEIPMTGTLDKPQFAFDVNKLIQNAVQQSILGGRNQQSTSQPAEQPDPLKALQDLLNRNKKKK